MSMTGRIDRRALLVASVATPIAVGATSVHSDGATTRPDLMLRQRATDAWQWCSWGHDGECWHPVRGMVCANETGSMVVTGPLPSQDRAELIALLREVAPARAISFTPER